MLAQLFKFAVGGILIAILGWFIILGLQYLATQNAINSETTKNIKTHQATISEDPYGGSTPEETLQRFIDTLKKEDTNSAAQYFVSGLRESWRQDLSTIKEKGLLADMIQELKTAALTEKNETSASFTLIDKNTNEVSKLILTRDNALKKWKISEL